MTTFIHLAMTTDHSTSIFSGTWTCVSHACNTRAIVKLLLSCTVHLVLHLHVIKRDAKAFKSSPKHVQNETQTQF